MLNKRRENTLPLIKTVFDVGLPSPSYTVRIVRAVSPGGHSFCDTGSWNDNVEAH